MPATSSEPRNRWRKRRRRRGETLVHRKSSSTKAPQSDDDAVEDEEDDDVADADEEAPNSEMAGPTETEILSNGGVPISGFPAVIKHEVKCPHSTVRSIVTAERSHYLGDREGGLGVLIENVSYGQLQALSAVPRDSVVLNGDGEGSFVITPPLMIEGRGVVKRFGDCVHVVPMHSDWFSPSTVHRLERQVVPHFFSGQSSDHTPENYMKCRNLIVAKCIENPTKRLSASDCQNLVDRVDNDDINRIVRFLDNWGIINYCAPPPKPSLGNSGKCLREDSKGELSVPADHLKSIDSLVLFDKPKCRREASDVYQQLASHVNGSTDLDSRVREHLSENRCNHCFRPLALVYYQSQKEIDVLLCLDCFHEGVFVAGHSSLDFVRVDSSTEYGSLDVESWTDQETLFLLEAIELYNEKWSEIAEHVGTKSKAQCILHFVRLSIDDASLENIELPFSSTASNLSSEDDCGRSHVKTNGNCEGPDLKDSDVEDRFPFAKSGNPVMSQVAFLASAVGPRVAAACAHASLAVLSEDDHMDSSGNSGPDYRLASNSKNGVEGISHDDNANSTKDVGPLSSVKVRNAARAGIAAAAMKAKLFADHEEREIQRLSANIINHQMRRLELKLKQFAEVETLLMKECEQVERTRQRVAAERALMNSSQFVPGGGPRPAGLPGVGPSMVANNNVGNARQHVSGSPSQPFISGYANNQSTHPHMSQQSMYGFGPRLPLAAINPPSSTGSHSMMRTVSGSRSGFD